MYCSLNIRSLSHITFFFKYTEKYHFSSVPVLGTTDNTVKPGAATFKVLDILIAEEPLIRPRLLRDDLKSLHAVSVCQFNFLTFWLF